MQSFKSIQLFMSIMIVGLIIGSKNAEAWVDIAYYRFEEGTPGQTATGFGSIHDSSGNGLNGTPLNVQYSSNVFLNSIPQLSQQNKSSLYFGSGVDIPDNPKFQLTKSLTIEAFINPLNFNTWQQLIVYRGDDRLGLDPYYIKLDNNEIRFQIQDQSNFTAALSVILPAINQWYHIAGTLDDQTGSMKLYLNGTLASSMSTTIRPLSTLSLADNPIVSIGGPPRWGSFIGYIDEVRISDQVLRPDQFLNATPVPEPGSLVFSGLTITAILLISLKRKKRRLPQI